MRYLRGALHCKLLLRYMRPLGGYLRYLGGYMRYMRYLRCALHSKLLLQLLQPVTLGGGRVFHLVSELLLLA